jgi:CRISPR-associated protein Cas5 subtype I-C
MAKPWAKPTKFSVLFGAKFAFWSNVNTGSDQTSNLVPAHAGGVGAMRGILGKAAMRWRVHEIHLLREPTRLSVCQNELRSFDAPLGYSVSYEEQRTQRRTGYLRNVEILVQASIYPSASAREDDTQFKFEEMFLRRARSGQWFRKPYLGRRECGAYFELIEGALPPPVDKSVDYGLAYYDTDYDGDGKMYFAPLRMENGIVRYPSWTDVRKLGICRSIPSGAA